MFQSDAKLFLSANNNINSAKTLINECIRLLLEAELPESSDYENCKLNLEDSGINVLIDKVEETKESLMKLDQEFANEYMASLQEILQTSTIDTSNMSDEEKMQYSIQMDAYYKDYNYNLLYMLEKYEESGMLTPELESQLDMQRVLIEQFELQDQMSSLAVASDEYIELFKQNAELDKKLINLNPNLTEEEKKSSLQEYETNFNSTLDILELQRDINVKNDELSKIDVDTEKYYKKQMEIYQLQIDYYNNKGNLTEEEKAKLEELKNYKKLNNLYIKRLEVNDNYIPFDGYKYDDEIFTLKKEMKIATEDELEYLEMGFWERQLHYTGTFLAGTIEGIVNIEEQIFDGCVMICGEVGSWFGASTKWAEEVVKTDISGSAYRGFVLNTGLNENIAYGSAHDSGVVIGELAGTIALYYVGGTAVITALQGLKGMGGAAEEAFAEGASFHKAFAYSAIQGAVDAGVAYLTYGKLKDGTGVGKSFEKWLGSKMASIPGIKQIVNFSGNLVNKYGSAGFKDYVKSNFTSQLAGKILINASKEFIKEGNSCWIDGKYDLEKAIKAAGKAMIVTSFDKLVINPAVDKIMKGRLEKQLKEEEAKAKKYEQKVNEKLKKLEHQKAQASVDSLNNSASGLTAFGHPGTVSSLEKWQTLLSQSKDKIDSLKRQLEIIDFFDDKVLKPDLKDRFKGGYESLEESIYGDNDE